VIPRFEVEFATAACFFRRESLAWFCAFVVAFDVLARYFFFNSDKMSRMKRYF
jgi:hypothetical protein